MATSPSDKVDGAVGGRLVQTCKVFLVGITAQEVRISLRLVARIQLFVENMAQVIAGPVCLCGLRMESSRWRASRPVG